MDEELVIASSLIDGGIGCWNLQTGAEHLRYKSYASPPHGLICVGHHFIASSQLRVPRASSGSILYWSWSKVKAMELVDELEVSRRGPYSVGFGGISFSGDMDIALALRTIVFPTSTRYDTMYSYKDTNKRREWVAHLQAGAGIVADSDPADEQRECENKAAGLARAIDLVEDSFVNK